MSKVDKELLEKKALKQFIRLDYPERIVDQNGVTFERVSRAPWFGVMVATSPDNIGFSVISPEEDLNEKIEVQREIEVKGSKKRVTDRIRKWSKEHLIEFGTRLAFERAKTGENPKSYNKDVLKALAKFKIRAEHYFKN